MCVASDVTETDNQQWISGETQGNKQGTNVREHAHKHTHLVQAYIWNARHLRQRK